MKTTITFKVVQDRLKTVDILDRIEEGFGEFDRIVKQYTRFDENSELSNLNRNIGNWVQISEEFFKLIEYMLELGQQTDGVFDPTIIDFLEAYGYDKNYDFSKLDKPEINKMIEKTAKERHSFEEIQLDKKNLKVRLAKGQRIDLGGVGKGYAIDCAFDKLKKDDDVSFLIDAGGDIRVHGKNENGNLWKVALKNKNADDKVEDIGFVELHNQALASSGSWARKVKQFHHLLNPKTGLPENKYSTVYVLSDTGMDADAWATILFVGGVELVSEVRPDLKFFTI